ncbi:MAG: hypothetical protein BWX61_00768 [Bacteroidetes bacterium ADurb.Bin035]|jgi:hypothetical protein|nr:MAG: hypothetical protein BWX61_00768 [Bacteroidetes bacterium ADurb.Bin035]
MEEITLEFANFKKIILRIIEDNNYDVIIILSVYWIYSKKNCHPLQLK